MIARVPIEYPESDGLPVADNTKQLCWIVVIFGNLSALFAGRKDVFVGADLFWYPVEGHPEIRVAPDGLVAFGRPPGHRGSYKQWEEDDIPLAVVFEILSPRNTVAEMTDKLTFYEEYGVEEYYLYDPDSNHLTVYVRRGDLLRRVRPVHGFVSPRLGIRFDLSGPEMVVYGPDGKRFQTLEESKAAEKKAEERAEEAERTAKDALRQADEARRQADQVQRRSARMVELGRKARSGQATPEELAELERLEAESRS